MAHSRGVTGELPHVGSTRSGTSPKTETLCDLARNDCEDPFGSWSECESEGEAVLAFVDYFASVSRYQQKKSNEVRMQREEAKVGRRRVPGPL
jgi:hypothetical protein